MNKITQAEAARLKGVKRQRINQLVKSGRLILDKAGLLNTEDVLSLTEGKRGRPKLSYTELIKRNPTFLFKVNEEVLWSHKPRDGFGYSVWIYGKVNKIGSKRIEIRFTDQTGNLITSWVKPERLSTITNETSDR